MAIRSSLRERRCCARPPETKHEGIDPNISWSTAPSCSSSSSSRLEVGVYAFSKLDIEAYPDPSPPLVEIITQNPSWSAEEMEQQVTVPVEATLNGTPHLDQVRSISIFGLSDVKLYFNFDSDYFRDKQEVLNRLQTLTLPNGLQPQLSPWSPIGEIYRYHLTGPRLFAQRTEGHAGLAGPPRAETGSRHYRHHHLWWHHPSVSGRSGPQ